MAKSTKGRHWAGVVYPESLPPDWKQTLEGKGLMLAISPLHDKDIDPDGNPKKPHYHIIMSYEGPTTYNVVKGIMDELHQPAPQKLESVRGYYRYLTHKDNPEKAQYDENDIVTVGGFDIMDFVEMKKSEIVRLKKKLQHDILELGFTEYCDFMDYVMFNGTMEEYDVASSHTLFFTNYMKGKKWKIREEAYRVGQSRDSTLTDPNGVGRAALDGPDDKAADD